MVHNISVNPETKTYNLNLQSSLWTQKHKKPEIPEKVLNQQMNRQFHPQFYILTTDFSYAII